MRQAIEKQNAERTAAGDTPIAAGPLLELAEQLVPKVRAAEWRDRAEAAQRDLEVIDLRDLRSVVSAADAAAKDDETRALAQALREGLVTRADAEHQAWLAELTATVDVGRIVRALRLSSRPPKAGAPLPPELADAARRRRRRRPHRGCRRPSGGWRCSTRWPSRPCATR